MAATQFVYLHGQPGSPDELRLFGAAEWIGSPNLFAPDRGIDRPNLALAPYLDHLAERILARFPEGPIRLVGFSLGGFIAMELADRLEARVADRVLRLDLVSAAAPLDLGDFLRDMAGGMVFDLARRRPRLFGLLTRIQGVLARRAPRFLFSQLFAGAEGADRDLAGDLGFRTAMGDILSHSLANSAHGYRREIEGYVAQTTDRLSRSAPPMTLWQGLADTWTPPAMAQALAAAEPETRTIRLFDGLSHYSTLRRALPEIFSSLR